MPLIDCHVILGKTALIKLDEFFPECKTMSSTSTPRLVCLPKPHSCSECKSLPSLIRRYSGLFDAAEWELIVLHWEVTDTDGTHIMGLASKKKDPAEVELFQFINPMAFDMLKRYSEEYRIDMPLYT